jgi:hypothetical protein
MVVAHGYSDTVAITAAPSTPFDPPCPPRHIVPSNLIMGFGVLGLGLFSGRAWYTGNQLIGGAHCCRR